VCFIISITESQAFALQLRFTVAVSASLSGAHLCPSVTESHDNESCDKTESDFLFEQLSDDVDGDCVYGLTGLYNHGNTCYVNATIQALSNWCVCVC